MSFESSTKLTQPDNIFTSLKHNHTKNAHGIRFPYERYYIYFGFMCILLIIIFISRMVLDNKYVNEKKKLPVSKKTRNIFFLSSVIISLVILILLYVGYRIFPNYNPSIICASLIFYCIFIIITAIFFFYHPKIRISDQI
jgi:hypothetical protein